jgi:signal peptidase I
MNWKFWQKTKEASTDTTPKKKKSKTREWTDAILFAVIAATIIRMFTGEMFNIPTGSMEKSLLIGDFLIVSKLSYGPRTPMTPIAFPLTHHSFPVIGVQSYLDWVQWGYHRLPGFGDIQRNDVVVFNYPMEYKAPLNRPVDKREHYIKRCVGIPGDTIEVRKSILYVNGKLGYAPPKSQMEYIVRTNGSMLDAEAIMDMGVTDGWQMNDGSFNLFLTPENAAAIKQMSNIVEVRPNVRPDTAMEARVFPHDTLHYRWNADHYGKIWIPKKGATVTLTPANICFYRELITVYEHNTLEEKNGKFFINGKEAKSYTFNMNYYWMMGDNRHNSEDSRYWGFVPEDHVVGKALFIFFSLDEHPRTMWQKVRWNRLFMGIH